MIKKVLNYILSILMLFSFVSCNNVNNGNDAIYSFGEITDIEITDVIRINIDYKKGSDNYYFGGDINNILDLSYIISDLSYNESNKIKTDYEYKLSAYNDKNYCIYFYAYNNKLFYYSNTYLYESLNKIKYADYNIKQTSEIDLVVDCDYGFHEEDRVTILLGSSTIWFNINKYGIDSLVAGDILTIKYTGVFSVRETYPSTVESNKMNIISIEQHKADIEEYIVSTNEDGEKILKPSNPTYSHSIMISDEIYAILEDYSFVKINELEIGSKVYMSSQKAFSSSIINNAFYLYNPRN